MIEELRKKLGGPLTRLGERLFEGDELIQFLTHLSQGDAGRSVVNRAALVSEDHYPWLIESVSVEQGAQCDTDYQLDLSSVWEVGALVGLDLAPRRILDLCAAPGGKSMLVRRMYTGAEQVSNEVVPKRLGILRSNLKRCQARNLWTQRLRPEQWGEAVESAFDLILVDAPCSGQSLLAKGEKNLGCAHPVTVKGNAKRQKGILKNILPCLAPGGTLLYSTCTFAPEENEKVVAWVLKNFPSLTTVEVKTHEAQRSPLSEEYCYRLYPQNGLGSGGFVTVFRKEGDSAELETIPEELLNFPIEDA